MLSGSVCRRQRNELNLIVLEAMVRNTDIVLHSTKLRTYILDRCKSENLPLEELAQKSSVPMSDFTSWLKADQDRPDDYFKLTHIQVRNILQQIKSDMQIQIIDYSKE